MDTLIPHYTDASEWQRIVYANTGGTRSKTILLHPETGDQYFFKGSKELDSGEFRYPTEFWSEIVASKIGQLFGFEMLDYNIAYNTDFNQKIGCLSKSMVNNSINKLTEGKEYLIGYDGKYDPEKHKKNYTFQFISSALKSFELDDYIKNMIEIIVFDALIGNSDRHQENWAVITNFEEAIHKINKTLDQKNNGIITTNALRLLKWTTNLHEKYFGSNQIPKRMKRQMLRNNSTIAPHHFSPIYDSGCCLGREIEDKNVKDYLTNPQKIEKYLKKGTSEIHWDGFDQKKSHFELIELVRKDYPNEVNTVLKNIKENFDEKRISELIMQIDSNLPETLKEHKLSEERKELMIKLITLRGEKLKEY